MDLDLRRTTQSTQRRHSARQSASIQEGNSANVSVFENLITEGNEKADELAKRKR